MKSRKSESEIQREVREVADTFGLRVDSERLSDGSVVFNLLLNADVVHCVSQEAAWTLRHEIAAAIHKATR